jgi:hypothetical protein
LVSIKYKKGDLMHATPRSRLSVETEFYDAHKSEWLRDHRDKFVVIKGEHSLGFFGDFQAAYLAGVENLGIDSDFLVKRVVAQEPVFVVF